MTFDPTGKPTDSFTPASTSGFTQPSQPGGRGGFLSDVVLDLGFATSDEVSRAVAEAREPGKLFERVLVERGAVDENQLAHAISERNGLPHVDLDEFPIDESAEKLISRDEALRYRALPLAFDADGALLVAMADPMDGLAVSDIAAITKSEVQPAVASASRITQLAEQLPARKRVVFAEPEIYRPSDDPKDVGPAAMPEPEADEDVTPASYPPAAEQPLPIRADQLPRQLSEAPASNLLAAASSVPSGGVRTELRDRIVELVEIALDDASAAELGRLEGELGKERATSDELRARVEDFRKRIEVLEGERDRLHAGAQKVKHLE